MRWLSAWLFFVACGDPAFPSCRHALALGLDVSGSVDAQEYQLQLDGVAAALNSDAVSRILFDGPAAPIKLAIFEWSGPSDQVLILPWTALDNASARAIATEIIVSHNRMGGSDSTAIGSAMDYGLSLLEDQKECWRRTLDISGDGETNSGPRPQDIATQDPNLIINGLVVGSGDLEAGDQRFADIKQLSSHYRRLVIRGPGAFVETALGFEAYAAAMERKLVRELQSISLSFHEAETQ